MECGDRGGEEEEEDREVGMKGRVGRQIPTAQVFKRNLYQEWEGESMSGKAITCSENRLKELS